jgi:PAS domain S-box-containing protein
MPFRWLRRAGRPSLPADASEAALLVTYLAGLLPGSRRAGGLFEAADVFYAGSTAEQQRALPGLYLRFEQALTEGEPALSDARLRLRATVRRRHPALLDDPSFGLIFEPESLQEAHLGARYLDAVLVQQAASLEPAFVDDLRLWLKAFPALEAGPPPLGRAMPTGEAGATGLLQRVGVVLQERLAQALGERSAVQAFEAAFNTLADRYERLPTFPAVVALLPDALLDESRLTRLSLGQMRRVLLDKAEALERSLATLRTRNEALEAAQRALLAATEEARNSSARLGAVLRTVGEGIISADAEGPIVFVNDEAERIFGHSAVALAGRPLVALMPAHYRDAHRTGFARYAETGAPRILGRRIEVEGLRADGSVFPLEVSIVETAVGDERHFTAAVRDITDRKAQEFALVEARDRAEEMARLKSTFLANMSHEIRTPLTAILGFADLLADELPPDKHEFVHYIQEGGHRLLDMLNSVLDLARLEAGSATVALEPLDVMPEMHSLAGLFSRLAAKKTLTLTVEGPDWPVRVQADRSGLARVMSNLVGNAIKFTDQGGVTVRVVPDGAFVALHVVDTGVGIEPDFLPYLFDEFRQESAGIARSHEGAGLGLALSKRLVDLMGGTISAESTKGAGSTFTVRLQMA